MTGLLANLGDVFGTTAPLARVVAGSTRVMLSLCCLLGMASCCPAAIRKQHVFTAACSSRAGLQGMMLWGPVSLPEAKVLVDCLQLS